MLQNPLKLAILLSMSIFFELALREPRQGSASSMVMSVCSGLSDLLLHLSPSHRVLCLGVVYCHACDSGNSSSASCLNPPCDSGNSSSASSLNPPCDSGNSSSSNCLNPPCDSGNSSSSSCLNPPCDSGTHPQLAV